jgi:type II restriction enzyme
MQLFFNKNIAEGYKSPSQKTRVLTENWVGSQIFCPNCGCLNMNKHPNNSKIADFYCSACNENYELKSKQKSFGAKIIDGDYKTMISRLESSKNPNFFLLNYDFNKLSVLNFLVIPKHFFIPEIIEKRKPLAPTAERHDWVGCNILLQTLPSSGKIFFIKDQNIESKENVLSQWQKTLFLREEKEISAKGWLLDVMKCVDKLNKKEFTLDDVYFFEKDLNKLHPKNRHIKDKIRQQLQILRDKGYLDFVSRGFYRVT